MELKELRKNIGLTQPEAALLLNIPFRTYCRYEDDKQRENTFKYNQMIELLNRYAETVVLKLDTIKSVVFDVLSKHDVSTCYLFGSYAKGKANNKSDIDLMIVSDVEGIEFYQMIDELESKLNKTVDLIRLDTAIQNVKLMNEILKDGIKIYG
jgi:predicted nucleotidyltransferase